jgi:hypothetical protein
MGYTPYKMVGHTLPGIKQRSGAKMRSFGTKDSDMPDKVSQKSGLLYSEGGVGSSPAKGFWDKVKSFGKKALTGPLDAIKNLRKEKAEAQPVAQPMAETGVQPHGDEMHTGGDGAMQEQSVNPAMVGRGAGISGVGGAGMSANDGGSGVGGAFGKINGAKDSMWGGIGS